MSVRIRLRDGKGKKMEKKQENCFHPVSVVYLLLAFDLRYFFQVNNI